MLVYRRRNVLVHTIHFQVHTEYEIADEAHARGGPAYKAPDQQAPAAGMASPAQRREFELRGARGCNRAHSAPAPLVLCFLIHEESRPIRVGSTWGGSLRIRRQRSACVFATRAILVSWVLSS